MKTKKELPTWAVVSAIGAAVVLVAMLFVKGGSMGDPSADEIAKIRNAQSSQASKSLSAAAPTQR